MNTIIRTEMFDSWLSKLTDIRAKARIFDRIRSAQRGNFRDCEPVSAGVSEMRIRFGSGYRVHYTLKGDVICVLLCGGPVRLPQQNPVRGKYVPGF